MKKLFSLVLLILISSFINSQEYKKVEAEKIMQGTEHIYYNSNKTFPTYIKFSSDISKSIDQILSEWQKNYNLSYKLLNVEKDLLGFEHYKYQQYYDTIPVEWAIFKIHVKNEKVESYSGTIWLNLQAKTNPVISKNKAIEIAIIEHNADVYMWQDKDEEKYLKMMTKDENATYYPKPQLVIYKTADKEVLAYKLTIYSKYPHSKKDYYIDAEKGNIIDVIDKIHHTDTQGTAVTKYSGIQPIITDYYNGYYRLRESGRGNGIFTFNMQMGSNYYNAVDFTDDDNYWNNVNPQKDEVATDAHWATEKYYDYFLNTFNRNSIDNNGFALYNYIHANLIEMGLSSNVNAFWNGYYMTYGDGDAMHSPLTTVDIIAHEITHGLTEFTAGLVYAGESGALNEAFSDIFGTVVEFYAKPNTANWTIGEDIGSAFRSLANPNYYENPDTYFGDYWDLNNEVHNNGTVMSHWFYIVVNGKTGANDLGNNYSVTGIGMEKAAKIAYYTLVNYLPPNATYYDARFFTIVVATNLYGACSAEVQAITDAMYAIGVGEPYQPQVIANFTANITENCEPPLTVQFINQSNNGMSYYWDFGDGYTSTNISPTHTFNNYGNYTVKLIADGDLCGTDTLIMANYISIAPDKMCHVVMPLNGYGGIITHCHGIIYDGGGPNGNYDDMSDARITISPPNATSITLFFNSFDIEPGSSSYCNYDYLEIFDGPNTNSPSMGRYCNTTGAPDTIISSGGQLTLLLHSDQALNLSGFEAVWVCNAPDLAPLADFSIDSINKCNGFVKFIDRSFHNPTSWLWDFGDGTTSNLKSPIHIYNDNGDYNVSLTATNNYGTDMITKQKIVNINRPAPPLVINDTICENESATLIAIGNGVILWYSSYSDLYNFYNGSTYITPPLSQTTTYWVQDFFVPTTHYVGDTRSSSNGGFFTNTNRHYLTFDCFTECTLVSVEVNASSAGNRLIELTDYQGNTITSKNVYIPKNISRVHLDFALPVANNLKLWGPGTIGNSPLKFLNFSLSKTVLIDTISFLEFGTSIPTVPLPGIGAIIRIP
jgi:Zn-dependent metalloprotease